MGNSPSAEAEKSKAVEGAATSTPASRPKDGGAQDAATVVDPTMLPVSNLPANLQFKFGVEILDDLNTAALLVADTVGLYLLGSAVRAPQPSLPWIG